MRRRVFCLLCLMVMATAGWGQTAGVHPWQGRRVAYLGDSLTDPNNDGSTLKYWNFLQQWLGIEPLVYGISGCQWCNVPEQAARLKAEHGDDVDAIIIFMGTNDFAESIPIGEWYEESVGEVVAGLHEKKHAVSRLQRHFMMTGSTLCGRINIAMDSLKRMYPEKQIVVLTPIHRAGFYAAEDNWQPTEDYQNKCGEYFLSYVEKIKQMANVWAVPVIDMNAASGLFPMIDAHADYFHSSESDRLHPNDKGHRRLARTLMYQLSALPCVF